MRKDIIHPSMLCLIALLCGLTMGCGTQQAASRADRDPPPIPHTPGPLIGGPFGLKMPFDTPFGAGTVDTPASREPVDPVGPALRRAGTLFNPDAYGPQLDQRGEGLPAGTWTDPVIKRATDEATLLRESTR